MKNEKITDQLRKLQMLPEAEKFAAYVEACKKAPDVSDATKRKWLKALFPSSLSI